MHVAILLAGPSLANLDTAPVADLTIGAKRAALKFPCDWVIVLDRPDLRSDWFKRVTAPLLLTRREYRPHEATRPGLDCEGLTMPHMPTRWGCFSSSAALALASHLGATRIDAYGADFGEGETQAEYDGYVSPEARYDANRWAFEIDCWNKTAEATGVKVTRHGFAR